MKKSQMKKAQIKKNNLEWKQKAIKEFDRIIISEYAKVFVDHFSNAFNSKNGHNFEVEVWYCKSKVLMQFKVIPEPSKEYKQILWIEKENKEISKKFKELYSDSTLKKLFYKIFTPRKLMGFEKDFFYIGKPNELKYWSVEFGWIDRSVFMDELHFSKKT